MPRKLSSFTTVIILLGASTAAPLVRQMPAMSSPTGQMERDHKSAEAEMTAHQKEMQALNTKLGESFQAIADARGAKGYVHDPSILKTHGKDIKALRDAVRDHKLFLSDYEHTCGVNSKQQDAMIQHQKEMKGILYDVVETYDTYEETNDAPNNPNYVAIEGIGPSFEAHRAALKELTSAINQHQEAMTQMMKQCS